MDANLDHIRSDVRELTVTSNDPDWETTSETSDPTPDSFERPVQQHDLSKLAEIPVKTLVSQSESVSWMAPVLNYSNPHKGYELAMVCPNYNLWTII